MESRHFKSWNRTTAVPQKSAKEVCFLRVNKSGQVRFSEFLASQLGIKPGDGVEFFSGVENPNEWFVSKCKNQNGLIVRISKNTLFIQAKLLAEQLLRTVKNDVRVVIRVSGVPEAMPKCVGVPPVAFRMYVNECK